MAATQTVLHSYSIKKRINFRKDFRPVNVTAYNYTKCFALEVISGEGSNLIEGKIVSGWESFRSHKHNSRLMFESGCWTSSSLEGLSLPLFSKEQFLKKLAMLILNYKYESSFLVGHPNILNWVAPYSGTNVTNKFNRYITVLCSNKALGLYVASDTTSLNKTYSKISLRDRYSKFSLHFIPCFLSSQSWTITSTARRLTTWVFRLSLSTRRPKLEWANLQVSHTEIKVCWHETKSTEKWGYLFHPSLWFYSIIMHVFKLVCQEQTIHSAWFIGRHRVDDLYSLLQFNLKMVGPYTDHRVM